jgi:tRNA A-37 threonylcarbamoyl transferase component Bud32
LISEEVPLDRHLRNLAVWVGKDALSDALQAGLSNPVMTQIKELETSICLQGISQSTCTINIKDIAVQRQALNGRVGRQGGADADHARNSKLA